MNESSRAMPEHLPPLERIGRLVSGCIIPDARDGSCLDCGAERDSDDVTEHADHCGLAAALTAYFEYRRAERSPGDGFDPEARAPKPGASWVCSRGKGVQCGDCPTPSECRWVAADPKYRCPCLVCPRCEWVDDRAHLEDLHPEDGLAGPCGRCGLHEWWSVLGPIRRGQHMSSAAEEIAWRCHDEAVYRGYAD